jgi:hypothetical protein
MSIINKRNAILGWSVWQVGKIAAKRKARQALEPDGKGPGKGAALIGLAAAAGGALFFWRRRGGSESDST